MTKLDYKLTLFTCIHYLQSKSEQEKYFLQNSDITQIPDDFTDQQLINFRTQVFF